MRVLAMLAVATGVARADVVHVNPCACSPNKPGFHRREALTGDWNGVRDDLKEDGVTVAVTYAAEMFASPALSTRATFAGLVLAGVDVDGSKAVHDGFGTLHTSGLAIHGGGLSNELMDVYGVSNNVAPNDVRLFEVWYEQPIGKATLRVGQLAADQEFLLAKHSTALMNATFGIPSKVPVDVLAPVYPVATPGASARLELKGFVARVAIYDGDEHNNHGIPTQMGDHALVMSEVELADTLKLGAWTHTGATNGVYAVVDHQLDRYVGAFARASFGGSPVGMYVDTGIRIGPGPLRSHDFASVGMAFARAPDGDQTATELTYQYQVNGWLTVQPDFQVLLRRERTDAIFATRVVMVL